MQRVREDLKINSKCWLLTKKGGGGGGGGQGQNQLANYIFYFSSNFEYSI